MTIEAMAKWAELILLKEDHEVFKPRVLVLAFTGKAASLIGKKYINYFSFFFNYHGICFRWNYPKLWL